LLLALAALAAEIHDPVPVSGLADLHLHQWAELAYASRWYYGEAAGPAPVALTECNEVLAKPRRAKKVRHGVIVNGPMQIFAKWGMQDERSDDVRPRHPPEGVSTTGVLPNWLGWPTSDSLAHQQAWEGWLRLAHDGIPLLWHIQKSGKGEHASVHDEVRSFYSAYSSNMQDAAREGAVGVNLVVASLVHSNLMCRQQVSGRARRNNPAICNDMDSIKRQYDSALTWAHNTDWADIVTTPMEAEQTIRAGRLAVVLSLESADIFGPSQSIGDQSQFRLGYAGRAVELMEEGSSRREGVRQALGEYLDAMPKIATLQIAHQFDSPFSGGAFISNTFVKQQRFRDRRPKKIPRVLGEKGSVSCKKAAESWKWGFGEEGEYYPLCQAQFLVSEKGSPTSSGFLRLFQNAPPARHSLPRRYARLPPKHPDHRKRGSEAYTNYYGLSVDGEVLIELMNERGLLLDISHISRRTAEDIEDKYPDILLYTSHMYPEKANLLQREQNTSDKQLASLELAGVRPGDDETAHRALAAESPFAKALTESDCVGTSMGTALYLEVVAKAGVATAYGTDLNGFINMPAATRVLRPKVWGGTPCSVAVPSIGSEVADRGLAHIGLLPQLHMETLAIADRLEVDPKHLQPALRGAPEFIALWKRVWCDSDEGRECQEAPSAVVEPWKDWKSWVRGKERLRTIGVHLPQRRDPAINSALHALSGGSEDALGATGPDLHLQQLPLWRAIEATLPYYDGLGDETGGVLPQLPTQIGFQVGIYRMNASWERFHFPYGRCRWSGWNKLSDGATRKAKKAECAELREARQEYMKARRHQKSSPLMLTRWDRVYPGRRTRGKRSAESRLREIQAAGGLEESAWTDFPSYAITLDRLLADGGKCLAKPGDRRAMNGFLSAPPVGLDAGRDPSDWLEGNPRKRPKKCYCKLLRDADAAGITRPRDELALGSEACAKYLKN